MTCCQVMSRYVQVSVLLFAILPYREMAKLKEQDLASDFSLSTENAAGFFPMLDVPLGKQIMARPQVFSVVPTQKPNIRNVHLRENILECGLR